jgi:hypothetical protein
LTAPSDFHFVLTLALIESQQKNRDLSVAAFPRIKALRCPRTRIDVKGDCGVAHGIATKWETSAVPLSVRNNSLTRCKIEFIFKGCMAFLPIGVLGPLHDIHPLTNTIRPLSVMM